MVSLDHIALIVSSEESLRFYERLGFREFKRIERSYDNVVFMECGLVILEIFIDPNHPERMTDPEAKGLRYVAFTVDNLDEITKVLNCEEVRTDWFGNRFVFTADPDGQPIELKEKTTNCAAYNIKENWMQEYKKQFGTESSFS